MRTPVSSFERIFAHEAGRARINAAAARAAAPNGM